MLKCFIASFRIMLVSYPNNNDALRRRRAGPIIKSGTGKISINC